MRRHKVRNRIIVAAVVILAAALFSMPFFDARRSQDKMQRVFDNARLLTLGQAEDLTKTAVDLAKRRKVLFFIITEPAAVNIYDIDRYRDFIRYNSYSDRAVLLVYGVTSKDLQAYLFNDSMDIFTDEVYNGIYNESEQFFRDGDCYSGYVAFLRAADKVDYSAAYNMAKSSSRALAISIPVVIGGVFVVIFLGKLLSRRYISRS